MAQKGFVHNLLSHLSWEIYILLALPFLIAFVFTVDWWPFSVPGYKDTWLYLGYIRDLPSHFKSIGPTYYSTRLGHILPGYIFYLLFDPLWANYLFHFILYYIAIFSMFYLLSSTFNKKAAFLATLLFGLDPWFLYAIGDDYPNGTVIAYFLLSGVLLVLAVKSDRWKVWMILSGVAFTCALITHSLGILYLPILFLISLFLNHQYKKHSVLLASVLFAGGMVLGSAFFWGIYYVLSDHANIFAVKAHAFSSLSKLSASHFMKEFTFSQWPKANHLHMVSFIFLASIFFLLNQFRFMKTRSDWWQGLKNRSEIFYPALLIFFGILFIYFQYGFDFTNPMAHTKFTVYLLPVGMMALGALLSTVQFENRKHLWLGTALFVFVLLIPYWKFIGSIKAFSSSGFYWILLSAWVGAFLILIGASLLNRRKIVFSLLFPGIFLYGFYQTTAFWKPTSIFWNKQNSVQNRKAFFQDIVMGMDVPKQFKSSAYFWYSNKDPNFKLFRSLVYTNLFQYRLVSEDFPNMNNLMKKPIWGRTLAILSTNSNEYEERGLAALQREGFRSALTVKKHIESTTGSFYITFIRITGVEPPKGKFGAPERVFEADLEFLKTRLEQNIYGKKEKAGHIKGEGKGLVFYPTTLRDHLATPFISIQKENNQEHYWLKFQLTYSQKGKPSAHCVVTIQDTGLNTHHRIPCYQPGLEISRSVTFHFKFPGDVSKIRMVIRNREKFEPTFIPNKIIIDKYVRKKLTQKVLQME